MPLFAVPRRVAPWTLGLLLCVGCGGEAPKSKPAPADPLAAITKNMTREEVIAAMGVQPTISNAIKGPQGPMEEMEFQKNGKRYRILIQGGVVKTKRQL